MNVPADLIREACDMEISILERDIASLQRRLRQVQYDREECRLRLRNGCSEVDSLDLACNYVVVDAGMAVARKN